MSKVTELRTARAKAVEDARAILNRAEAEGRAVTAEEREQCQRATAEAKRIRDEYEALEEQSRMSAELADMERDLREPVRTPEPGRVTTAPDVEKERTDRFRAWLRTGDGRPIEFRALQMDSPAAGGNLVPPVQWVNRLIAGVNNAVYMRGVSTVIPLTDGQEIQAPSLDADPADPSWTAEVGSVSEDSTMAFGKRSLKPVLLAKLLKVSQMLVDFSPNAETIVADRLAYKVAVTEENNFLNGTGAMAPLGVFTASDNGISTSRDISNGNTTTAIKADGVIRCLFNLKPQYRRTPNTRWIFHTDAVLAIQLLKDGNGQYLWQQGLTAGTPDMIKGIPVLESQYAPNTFTTGLYVGIVGDFSNYWIADALTMRLQRLNELYAGNSQVGFIIRRWTDGMPVLEEAFSRMALA